MFALSLPLLIQQKTSMEELARRAAFTPYVGRAPATNLTMIAIAAGQWWFAFEECKAEDREWSVWPCPFCQEPARNEAHVRSL